MGTGYTEVVDKQPSLKGNCITWFQVFLLTPGLVADAFFIEATTVAMALRTNEISAVFCRCNGMFRLSLIPSMAS
jgi:hypothetical protein